MDDTERRVIVINKVANGKKLTKPERDLVIKALMGNIVQAPRQVRTSHSPDAPRELSTRVVAKPGDTSICSSCGKHIYTVNRDVIEDGMTNNEFRGAFTPTAQEYELTRDLLEKVRNINGNIQINCPACKGDLSLDLIGRRGGSTAAASGMSPGIDVSTIGGEEYLG